MKRQETMQVLLVAAGAWVLGRAVRDVGACVSDRCSEVVDNSKRSWAHTKARVQRGYRRSVFTAQGRALRRLRRKYTANTSTTTKQSRVLLRT